jgi:NADPH-dependent 2,4-dienoyl-CoA reductase/sulfur reductase-like enzyme/nitrite reductase/ring-hydroxylating ferredoxin subunit
MKQKEITVARSAELKDGEMKQVAAGGTNILLARVNGQYHAVGATCPHYGAPLAEGALSGERIVCPWHHACFNVTTGDLEEPPALDALPRYEVRVENENVIVRLPEDTPDRRTPPMTNLDAAAEARLFVILGGGAAGYAGAQTLREEGFRGRVLMITREDRLPYDRPNLSKDYLQGHAEPGWMPLRPDEFFTDHNIEVMRGKEVARVDTQAKTVSFKSGEQIAYDALLVATGGEPRTLQIAGSDLKNVLTLRSFADSDAIIAAAEASKRAVVIGASFIGMEAAASLKTRGLEVTVVAPDQTPFEKTLGGEIGALLQKIHEDNGVRFRLGAKVARISGNGKVEAVELESGKRLEADMVVVGVGVRPATDFLVGINLHNDGGVIVDEHLRAAADLYAAGDIAWFPSALTGERQRIEHWRTALQQGRIAARNMAGKNVAYNSVPFFWTRQFDAGLLYVGHATSWDEIIFQGDVPTQNFLAFYVKGNRVRAVAGMNRDRDMAAVEALMRDDRMPTPDQLRSSTVNLLELLRNPELMRGGRR